METLTKEEMAKVFNEFFVQKISKLKDKIPPKQAGNLKIHTKKKSGFSFRQTSPKEVIEVISSMKNSASSGIDLISTKDLKLVKNEVANAIAYHINVSLQAGHFAENYKIAKVSPLYKGKGNRHENQNFRPVSCLSTVGNIQETIVNTQMKNYCEKLNILGQHQHGFRTGRSTTSTTNGKKLEKRSFGMAV